MIVEYLGLPGSGKTYQANLYKKKIEGEGMPYCDISRYKGMALWLKVFYKVADYAILWIPKYRKQIKEYNKICIHCPQKSSFLSASISYYIKDIVLYSFVYDIFGNSNRIIINDEGMLHRLITLIVQFNPPIEKLLSLYLSTNHGERRFYIGITVENAFKNIKNRNRKVCSMDELDDKTFLRLLHKYYETFQIIINSKCVNLEIINNEQESGKNSCLLKTSKDLSPSQEKLFITN